MVAVELCHWKEKNHNAEKLNTILKFTIICKFAIRKLLHQKQPSRVVPRKTYSENMQQIYGRTSMSKCDFNKVALELYLKFTSMFF